MHLENYPAAFQISPSNILKGITCNTDKHQIVDITCRIISRINVAFTKFTLLVLDYEFCLNESPDQYAEGMSNNG